MVIDCFTEWNEVVSSQLAIVSVCVVSFWSVQTIVLCSLRAVNVPAGTVTDSTSTTVPFCESLIGVTGFRVVDPPGLTYRQRWQRTAGVRRAYMQEPRRPLDLVYVNPVSRPKLLLLARWARFCDQTGGWCINNTGNISLGRLC